MITIVEFEIHMASASILGVVVGKLSYWEELSPIILLIIEKNSKIGFHCIVLPLCLAISLEVKGSRESLLDFHIVLE